MRIGVVSDTHNHLRNVARIVELFNAAGVSRVVHTGDITQAKTLHALSPLICPVVGVYGNNDQERPSLDETAEQLGFRLVDPPLRFRWHERDIVVVHDPRDLARLELRSGTLALHGHTHRTSEQWQQDGTLHFNPGECAGMLEGRNAIGIVDLARFEVELIHF
ncbi:MAG: YfcE family phosphodiesterase [bacterium]|nr:YfcE family phosphodiesterase [bacterium]MCP5068981.1 YfcE family phosphodiesterase [bacterium]